MNLFIKSSIFSFTLFSFFLCVSASDIGCPMTDGGYGRCSYEGFECVKDGKEGVCLSYRKNGMPSCDCFVECVSLGENECNGTCEFIVKGATVPGKCGAEKNLCSCLPLNTENKKIADGAELR